MKNLSIINSNIYFKGTSVNNNLENTDKQSFYSFGDFHSCSINPSKLLYQVTNNAPQIEDIYFENSPLSHSEIDTIFFGEYPHLNELGFNNIGTTYFFKELSQFIERNKSVQELIFRDNIINIDYLKKLTPVTRNNIDLFFLNSNGLDNNGFKYIFPFVRSLNKLKRISLFNNNIGNSVSEIFSPSLQKNITYLDLGYTSIDDNILDKLSVFLRGAENLEELYLDGNDFSENTINTIIDICEKFTSCKKINLADIAIQFEIKSNIHIITGSNTRDFLMQREIFVFGGGIEGEKDYNRGSIFYINKNSNQLIDDIKNNHSIKRICFTSLSADEFFLSSQILQNQNISLITYKNVDVDEKIFIKYLYNNIKKNKGIFEIRFYENIPINEMGIKFILKYFPETITSIYFNNDIMLKVKNMTLLRLLFIDKRVKFDGKYEYLNNYKEYVTSSGNG